MMNDIFLSIYNFIILKMRFYYSRSLLFGICLGIYYGEKRLPFPIQYLPKPDDVVGNIKIDLSIINTIVYDISKIGKTR